jgi:uncharacterized protein (UPF0548 family)
MTKGALGARRLSYDAVGATSPQSTSWSRPEGYRAFERTVRLGAGEACWLAASARLLAWGVKTRSGFVVQPAVARDECVCTGQRFWLLARLGPLTVREPVEVVATVVEPDRCGFAYGTLDGHPVSGEEAFVVHQGAQGDVWLTLRSLTRPGAGRWRLAFPLVLAAQRRYRRRYLRALAERPR